MYGSYRPAAFFLAAMLVLGVACSARAEAPDEGGTYESLDATVLAESLSEMGMTELLEAFIAEMGPAGESPRGMAILAEGKISQAVSGADPASRDKLLSEAASLLEKIVAATEKAADEEVIQHFRYKFRLAEVLGAIQARPYAMRLMYLQGGDEDRKMLGELTAKATDLLYELNDEISQTLEQWRVEPVKLITIVPELEELQEIIAYKSAWTGFYRGMSLTDGTEKQQLLADSINRVIKYARGEDETGVKFWSLLLWGMADRELKNFSQARETLKAAAAGDAAAAVRIEAVFEIARSLIEQAASQRKAAKSKQQIAAAEKLFKQARQAVGSFLKFGQELLGSEGQLEIDVKSALLLNYLYETWALCQSDPAKAQVYRQQSQKAMLAFVAKYDDPSLQMAFFEILATKYRARRDYDKLGSVVLVALAARQVEASADGSGERAEKLLRMVLGRKDPVSKQVGPLALWQLAMIMNTRMMNIEAGRLFAQLAEKYPDHRLAPGSARNAVISFHGLVRHRQGKGELVGVELRREFVKALEILLGKWGGRFGPQWYFELGWQYSQIAKVTEAGEKKTVLMTKAVTAYDKVPAGQGESAEARYLALALGVELVSDSKNPSQAKALVAKLKAFSLSAIDKARSQPPQVAKSLRLWGSRTEFYAARILYDLLGEKKQAMAILERMPAKWPDTPVLQQSLEFQIDKLLKEHRTDEAIVKVDKFRAKFPAEADQLIHLVASQIRDRIEKLRTDPAKAEELGDYRKAYLGFAKDLYDRAKAQKLGPTDVYPFKQMYAAALTETGDGEGALKLFRECFKLGADRREKQARRIDEEVRTALAQLRAVTTDSDEVKKLKEGYFEQLKEYGILLDEYRYAIELTMVWDSFARASDDAEKAERLAVMVARLERAYEALGKLRKAGLSVDANNIRGLARAHRALKHYDESLKYYKKLASGIDNRKYPALYWAAELELCQCVIDGFGGDSGAMGRLVVRIRQLRIEDEAMGGLYGTFNALEAEASKLAGR